jgi:hypothetical protein
MLKNNCTIKKSFKHYDIDCRRDHSSPAQLPWAKSFKLWDIDRGLDPSSPTQLSRAKSVEPQDINQGGFIPTTDNDEDDKEVKSFEPCNNYCELDPSSPAQVLRKNPS